MKIKIYFLQGPTINGVLNRVVDELKIILKKDFNKKMIESTAFKQFDAWWDEQKKSEKTVSIGGPTVTNNVSAVSSENPALSIPAAGAVGALSSSTTATPKEEPKNIGFSLNLEQPLSYDFTLGIKALGIPKKLSFRVIFVEIIFLLSKLSYFHQKKFFIFTWHIKFVFKFI